MKEIELTMDGIAKAVRGWYKESPETRVAVTVLAEQQGEDANGIALVCRCIVMGSGSMAGEVLASCMTADDALASVVATAAQLRLKGAQAGKITGVEPGEEEEDDE